MTLRKISNDNSAKYIPPTNCSPSENSLDHKPKTALNPKKQNKNFSKNNTKIIKDITT